MELASHKSSWLDRPLSSILSKINVQALLIALILVLAVLSRFIGLGDRVMSHDEVNHVVPTYSLYRGNGYAYDPVTHGPLQFHMMALSFFILGDSDFSARVPYALVSIATIVFVLFGFRRYLGRTGALIAGFLFMISPYMLFYGRYARNEAYGGLWTVLMLYSVLRYLEKGEKFSLYLLTVTIALHFTDKATSFIYNAQMLLFLLVLFVERVTAKPWKREGQRGRFLVLIGFAIIALLIALGIGVATATNPDTALATAPGLEAVPTAAVGMSAARIIEIGILGIAGLCILAAFVTLVQGLGWSGIRAQRTFDLMILIGTFTLPQLAPFPVRMLGWDPLDYTQLGMTRTAAFLVPLALISVLIGLWWKARFWLKAAAIFYPIFIVFFTTFFTNGKGLFMGLVASLGYWLSQQGVQRGTQPIYFYALVQIPVYEYLAALGAFLALAIGVRKRLFVQHAGLSPADQHVEAEPSGPVDQPGEVEPASPAEGVEDAIPPAWSDSIASQVASSEPDEIFIQPEVDQSAGEIAQAAETETEKPTVNTLLHFFGLDKTAEQEFPAQPSAQKVPVLALLLYWSLTSLVAYSLAGEKMPWLTVHIAGAMLLASGWGLGYLVETTPWKKITNSTGLAAILLLPVIATSLSSLMNVLVGNRPPFQGSTVEQLESTSNFTVSLILFIAALWGLFRLLRDWDGRKVTRLLVLTFFAGMAVLTARTAYTASFINYDLGVEYLVYAHAAPGPKQILAQAEEISRRITRGKDLVIAYDNESNYPYWWYLRDWPNKLFFGDKPTRDLRNASIIVVGDVNYGKVEPIVKDNYTEFEYMRLWWPMEDYKNLTFERIWNALTDRNMRQALINIWLNRDYTLYSQITTNKSLTLTNWSPAARERMYIRNDVLAQMWNYGAAPSTPSQTISDPYEAGLLKLFPDVTIGSPGTQPGQFNAPRGMDIAKDGTIFVADSRNHRIQHLRLDGSVIKSWGTFADVLKGPAPAGTLNEPWDVKVGPDGFIYVADTFNFRIVKFTADGQFVKMWGYFGQAEKPEAFWGPRGLAFDPAGRLYVTDTGNKRVVVFTTDGEPISSFGTAGFDLGQLDEPVGIAIDKQGYVYIADTWNQRIQVFAPDADAKSFVAVRSWDLKAWFGQSLDNKPYLALDSTGNVYVTDPEGVRVLIFSPEGKYLRGIGDPGAETNAFQLPSGIALDSEGKVWVSDGQTARLVRFTLPKDQQPAIVAPSPTGVGASPQK